ncbi:MAG TPA: alpha/beta hydrolase [Actinomycetota bacterium]|nr:alpha/beta hydrolase [Actinomycetota bacterium]
MTRIDTGTGVALDYEVHGNEGPWVVLIMGLAYGRWGWHWNAGPLAERGYRVVTFDNRGVGGSDAPPGPYTAAEMAADTAGLMDALGIERAHVVGTSLGGFVAQELALARPELIERLVLACTGFGGADFVPMPQRTLDLIELAPTLPDEERLRRFIENAFSDEFVTQRPDVVQTVIDFRRESNQPLESYMAQWNAGATFDASDRVHVIEAETLCITGLEDAVVDPRNTPLLAERVPGAAITTLPGGHLFFIEQAREFNRIVADFLAGGRDAIREVRTA